MTRPAGAWGERVLRPGRCWLLALLIGSAAGSWLCLWVTREFELRGGPLVGWVAAFFFAVAALRYAVMLLPGASYLRLGPGGLEIRSLLRYSRYPWSAVERIRVRPDARPRRVLFDLSTGYRRGPGRTWAVGPVLGRGFIVRPSGATETLPSAYGMSADDLVELLDGYRDRYATGRAV